MKTGAKFSISVIIACRNAARFLDKCLGSVTSLDYPEYEVILVDDDSIDNSIKIAEKYGVKIVRLDRSRGPGIARNRGVAVSKGEMLAFTDSDCTVEPDWLQNIAAIFEENDNICAVTGGYNRPISGNFIQYFMYYDLLAKHLDIGESVEGGTTANFACPKEIFLKTNGFAPYINEDMELAYELVKLTGKKVFWMRGNGVNHYFRDTVSGYLWQQYSFSAAVVETYFRYPGMLFSRQSFNTGSIVAEMLFAVLFLFLALASFFSRIFIPAAAGCLFVILAINRRCIKLVQKEGLLFVVKSAGMILLRDMVQAAGCLKGFFGGLAGILRRKINVHITA